MEFISSLNIWKASTATSTEDNKMIIDVSFGWRQDDETEDSNAGKNTSTQDQGDCDSTRPVAVLKSVDNTSATVAQGISVDPYDNGYWIKLPLQ